MKRFFTLLAIFGICATPMMKAQNFPDDPGTLMMDVTLSAETTTGDTLDMALTGGGAYAKGTQVTITAPERPGYTFVAWNDSIQGSTYTFTLTESVVFVAKYTHDQYHIKFVDADGNVLQEGQNFYGDVLDVEEIKPIHDNTDQYTYVFLGWEPEVAPVTGDQNYYAKYDTITNEYEIRFLDWDEEVLEIDTVAYGVMPQFKGQDPTRETAEGIIYTFNGWQPQLAEVTGEADYTAVYKMDTIQYQVTIIIDDQTRAQNATWGEEIELHATEIEGKHFTEWSTGDVDTMIVVTIVSDTTIVASYAVNTYEIRFNDWDDTTLEVDTIEHGAMPQYKGETPTREMVDGHVYTFTGWNPSIVAATADATYTAVYADSTLEYTVTIICGENTREQTVVHGTEITVTPDTIEGKHFMNWLDGNSEEIRLVMVISDTTFTAVYGDSYFSIPVTANAWTFFCLPMPAMGDLVYNADVIDASELVNPSWGAYNGATRASAKSGWETADASMLNPATGYIVYSEADGNLKLNVYTENLQTNTATVAVYQYEAEYEQNANWNFIGNPLFREISASNISADGNDASITIWNGTGYSNEMIGANGEATIQPMQAFFFQPSAGVSALTFGAQGQPAPARSAIEENSRIDIEATAGGYTDRTRVIFRSNSSLRYEAGRDASKFLTATAPVQLYFLDVDNVQCAQMVRPAGEDNMRLGYTLRQAGNITINMPVFAGEYELYDALTGRSYDLDEEFNIYSEAGTYNNRLELRPTPRAYTNVDNTTVQNFVVTNHGIYVLGSAPVSVYSMVGQLITTQQAQGLIVLTNGSYIVVSGEQAAKVVLQ